MPYGLLFNSEVDMPFGDIVIVTDQVSVRRFMKLPGPKYTPQNECEISPNLNKIDHNDGKKNIQLSWFSGAKHV